MNELHVFVLLEKLITSQFEEENDNYTLSELLDVYAIGLDTAKVLATCGWPRSKLRNRFEFVQNPLKLSSKRSNGLKFVQNLFKLSSKRSNVAPAGSKFDARKCPTPVREEN